MTTEDINRLSILLAGTLAIVVFGGLSVRHSIPAIEKDLKDQAVSDLLEARMTWADVAISGRDLTLSGVAPDAAARDAAARTATVWGVRKVENQLSTVVEFIGDGVAGNASNPPAASATPAAATPASTIAASTTSASAAPAPVTVPGLTKRFRTRITVVDNRLVLDGAVPGERQRQEFVELAQAQFSVAGVEASLHPATNAPDGWLRAAALGLQIADELLFGEINLVDRSLHVTGITATNEGDQLIRRIIDEQLPDGYSGTAETGSRSELDAVLRTSPELAQRVARRTRTAENVAAPPPGVLSEAACAAKFNATLNSRQILFSTASATLTADSRNLLDDLAAVLKRCSGTRIAIHGHTDDQGLMENNLALSQRRAESVMQHFVSRGVSLGRMSAQGYGEEHPVVPNESAENRAINRRIEFVFENG